MRDQIKDGLERSFVKHRLVVWQDPEERFREDFEAIDIHKVTKVAVEKNEFALKHRVLLEEPDTHFLIYRPGPLPVDDHNWLLDIELGYGLFKADKADLVRAELNLPPRFADLVRDHMAFFAAKARLGKLKTLLGETDGAADIRRHMLAVCAGADSNTDSIVEALLGELAQEKDVAWSLIERSGLANSFWAMVASRYGYKADDPSIQDLAQALFRGCYAMAFHEATEMTADASVLLNRWAGMVNTRPDFMALSEQIADTLDVAGNLSARPLDTVVDLHLFEAVDQAVLKALTERIENRDIPVETVRRIVQERRTSLWYDAYRDLYEALLCASELQARLYDLTVPDMTLDRGVEAYAETWFKVDQIYRKFILHRGRTVYADHLERLSKTIEHLYTDIYVPRLNAAWHRAVDNVEVWHSSRLVNQRRFFAAHVAPRRNRKSKVIVIISDALRYEAGEEFYRRIRMLSRFEAQLSPMLGVIPSYTQLGMASLLPNRDLRIQPDGQVKVDQESTTGTKKREAILASGAKGDTVRAVQAEDVDRMGKEDLRALIRDNDIVYVYHNVIDSIADSPSSESEACLAVERALDQLETLVRRLAGNNANNLIVTADHGFLYQAHPIHEGDFNTQAIDAPGVTHETQRFVLGHDLSPAHGLDHFSAQRAGLEGDMDILIPRSITRLGRKGKGSRFVHGGAALQEIVVPVVTINKARKDDLAEVSIEVIGSGSRTITTGQHTVRLYQTEKATEKRRPIKLSVGFEGPDGTSISNVEERFFDFTSDNARQREISVRLLLSKAAEAYNGGEIRLVLKRIDHKGLGDGIYKAETYRYTRRMGGDFDL